MLASSSHHLAHCVSTKSYQGIKIQVPVPATPALWFHSPISAPAKRAQTPLLQLPSTSRPWHCCSRNFTTDNRTAHRPMLHQPRHLPPHKKGMKCMTTKEGFSQISSLNYLPQKTTVGQPKMTLLTLRDTSNLSVSLLPCSHPFPPALHSHSLPLC